MRIVLLVLTLCLNACAIKTTYEPYTATPVRDVSVLLVLEQGVDEAWARQYLAKASDVLVSQTGIRLVPVQTARIDFPDRGRVELLARLHDQTRQQDVQFDMAYAFLNPTIGEGLQNLLIGDWQAVIDDTYRRFVVVKHPSVMCLVHETYHAFMFSELHTTGIMSGTHIALLPGVFLKSDLILADRDRLEIMENKLRDFRVKPVLAFREDELPSEKTQPDKTSPDKLSEVLPLPSAKPAQDPQPAQAQPDSPPSDEKRAASPAQKAS